MCSVWSDTAHHLQQYASVLSRRRLFQVSLGNIASIDIGNLNNMANMISSHS